MSHARAYYNEIDPFAAQWLRNLIAAGLIAAGEVDERSIVDVRPGDLAGYTQCHFFAGIGGWSYALRLAGWPDDRPVWTGSCPCQPFSAAGKGGGFDDERHLWPHFFRLIGERRPSVVFGEQVASPAGLAWLDLVQADMEGAGYAFAAVDCCSAGVGAPHIRQRIGFVADAVRGGAEYRPREGYRIPCAGRAISGRDLRSLWNEQASAGASRQRGLDGQPTGESADALHFLSSILAQGAYQAWGETVRANAAYRSPLATGVPGRVGRLRAYGNAINPHQFAAFIGAFLETAGGRLR